MDDYIRHQRNWRILYALCHRWICRKFALEHSDVNVEGPVIIIPNHSCAWDPLLVAMSLPEKQVYYVASEHLFRLGFVSRLLERVVAPIPRRKASSGADTVKACLRHLKAGHSVCLFAEGEQCWDGRSQGIFPATGKLVKASQATLVTFRIEGGYLSCPRWGKGVRRGKTRGYPVGIYPPERLKGMSSKEIDDLIENDIREDAWERQHEVRTAFVGQRRAEGLEKLLYLCPQCGKIGGLRTKNDRIFCTCGLDLRFREDGSFFPALPFDNLSQWSDWQKEQLRRRHSAPGEPLFSDVDTRLVQITRNHGGEELTHGELRQYEDRLVCGQYSFPISEISDMAAVLTTRLLFTWNEDYYEILGGKRTNILKYLQVWRDYRETENTADRVM